MSQLICDSCGRLYDWYPIGEGEKYICGAHLGGRECCGGKLRENECGGPREACGIQGCKECGGKTAPKPQQLSLEECVYWLMIAEATPAAKHAAEGHVWGVEAEGRYYAMRSKEARFRRWARQYIVIARLCFEAAKRIREARP